MKAIEFFSGIGGFAQAARVLGIEIVAAFDQDRDASRVYEMNYGLRPIVRNLDSIKAAEIPDADLWWMSPPCSPYTIRGAQRDERDPRALSLINLSRLVNEIKPSLLIIENVIGFSSSVVLAQLKNRLAGLGYQCFEHSLCPTQFGIPMRRPRVFFCALSHKVQSRSQSVQDPDQEMEATLQNIRPLSEFLDPSPDEALNVEVRDLERYRPVTNIVDPAQPGETAICFTSGYGRCWKASGSLLRMTNGNVRHFAPIEILRLLGFEDGFRLPEKLSLIKQWRLVGNSLDVRSVLMVLRLLRNKAVRVQ